ncbi:hypothetical protein MHB65_19925 [Lysinibacillus sp. FSL K6-0075]|uniref:hypothetical protein n=1 Tax=Lysinibacillus sp. FSL K6-0075 TaxID=2921415 RepID=UPI0031582980
MVMTLSNAEKNNCLYYLENLNGTGRIYFIGIYDDWNPRSFEGNVSVKIPLDKTSDDDILFETFGITSTISLEATILSQDFPSFSSFRFTKCRFKDPHGIYNVFVERAEAVKGKQIKEMDRVSLVVRVISQVNM